jgi:hypothetical protein
MYDIPLSFKLQDLEVGTVVYRADINYEKRRELRVYYLVIHIEESGENNVSIFCKRLLSLDTFSGIPPLNVWLLIPFFKVKSSLTLHKE